MKIYLELELRGDDEREFARMGKYMGNEVMPGLGTALFSIPASAWVAEITGFDPKYKFTRRFLHYKKDYSRSNSVGSRGVYANYILESGRVYDVKDNKDRYYCRVGEDGQIIKITESGVMDWLKSI